MKNHLLWLMPVLLVLSGMAAGAQAHAFTPTSTAFPSIAPRFTATPRYCHICDEDSISSAEAMPTARPTATYEPCRVCGEETPTPTPAPFAGPVVHFWFFYDSGCSACMQVYNGVLPRVMSNYRPEQVTVHTWDVTQGGAGVKQALEQQFMIAKGDNTEVFIGEFALLGRQEIETRLPELIDRYLSQGGLALVQPRATVMPTPTPTGVVHAVLFWSKTCPHCHEVINNVLPPLQAKYGDRLDIRMFELSDPGNAQLFERALDALRVPPGQWAVPFMIVGDVVMVGSVDVQQRLPALIEEHLAQGGIGLPQIPGLGPIVVPPTAYILPVTLAPTATATTPQPTLVTPSPVDSGCTLATPCAETKATLAASAVVPPATAATPRAGIAVVRAVLFRMDGCPHCHQVMTEVLPPLQQRYAERLDIRLIEVKTSQDIDRLYQSAATLGIPQLKVAVPFLIVGDRVLIGSAQISAELPALIDGYLAAGGVDFPKVTGWENLLAIPDRGPSPSVTILAPSRPEKHLLDVPFAGSVDLDTHSLAVSTLLTGFLDGVNPCSRWVISLLLALVVNTGSRRKTVLVGTTFLTVAAALYALIILGLFSVFAFIGYALWIRLAVALIALTFAVVNIKDYFWYKRGLSLTISDEQKPKIYRGIRSILAPNQSSLALVGATATMAAGVALIEMPCSAGLPILWTKLITANQVGVFSFVLLLGLYLLMYLLDEMVVFTSAVVTLRASRLEEKQGRILKLIGGIVMLALALVLLIDPTWMDSLANSLFVFGGAFILALLVLVVHRHILPRWGIVIGTEDAVKVTPVSKSK